MSRTKRATSTSAASLKFVVGLTVLASSCSCADVGHVPVSSTRRRRRKNRQPGPMAMTEQERLPPEPRLQAAPGFGVKLENGEWVNLEKREPEAEYRVLREQWERQLNCQNGESKDASRATSRACRSTRRWRKLFEGEGLPVASQGELDEAGRLRDQAADGGKFGTSDGEGR